MYIALGIMFAGMLVGRLLRGHVAAGIVRRLIMAAILLLLFLLGAAIGANEDLIRRLPDLGWQSLALMFFCVGGSIACAVAIRRFLKIR